MRVQGLHVSRITRHVSNTLRSPDTNSYVHRSLKGSSNCKCVDESLDKTRYFTRKDSKHVVENKTSGSLTPVTDSISRVLNSDSSSSSTCNQLKLDMIKKMQTANACFINSDKTNAVRLYKDRLHIVHQTRRTKEKQMCSKDIHLKT